MTTTATTITVDSLPLANTIDPVQDRFLIYTASALDIQGISRNTALGLSSQPLGLSDSQSPTNKTFNNTNSLTVKDTNLTIQDDGDTTKQAKFQLSGITTATTRTYTLPNASSTLADISTTQTFTNKTLTSPVIIGGSADNIALTVDTIAGHTAAGTGTIYGLNIVSGVLNTDNSVVTANVATSAITSPKIATDSHIISYVEVITGQTFATTGPTDVTDATVTFTTPDSCTKILLRAEATVSCDDAGAGNMLSITDDSNVVQVERTVITGQANINALQFISISRRITVVANTSYTFKLRLANTGGSSALNQGDSAATPTILWVERA